jgi:hypothetical protein
MSVVMLAAETIRVPPVRVVNLRPEIGGATPQRPRVPLNHPFPNES